MLTELLFVVLALACVLVLIFPQHYTQSRFVLLNAICWALAVASGLADLTSMLFGVAIVGTALAARHGQQLPTLVHRGSWLLLFVLVALAFMHSIPGVETWVVTPEAFVLQPGAAPNELNFKLGKPLATLALAYAVGDTRLPMRQGRPLWLLMLLGLPLFMLLAYFVMGISWFPKWSWFVGLWLARNLFFVCIAEELAFRGWLQRKLGDKLGSQWAAIGVMAPIFGVAHLHWGLPYTLLAIAAGGLYGAAYLLSGRLYVAVLVHFAVNALHFTLFTY